MASFLPDSLLPNHEEELGKGSPGAGSPLYQQVLGPSPQHMSIHIVWPVLLTHTTQAQVAFPSRAPPGLSFPDDCPSHSSRAPEDRPLGLGVGRAWRSSTRAMVGSEGQSDRHRGSSHSAARPGVGRGSLLPLIPCNDLTPRSVNRHQPADHKATVGLEGGERTEKEERTERTGRLPSPSLWMATQKRTEQTEVTGRERATFRPHRPACKVTEARPVCLRV